MQNIFNNIEIKDKVEFSRSTFFGTLDSFTTIFLYMFCTSITTTTTTTTSTFL